MHAKSLHMCPTICNPMTIACQASLSMGFSRQEYWSGLSATPSQGDLSDPGIKPASHVSCIGRSVLYHQCPGKPLPWYNSHLYSYYIVESILFQGNKTFLPETGCTKVHQEDVPITLIFLNQDMKSPCRGEMMSLWIARSSENFPGSLSPQGPQIYHKPTGQLCMQSFKLPWPHIFSNKPGSLFCKTYK